MWRTSEIWATSAGSSEAKQPSGRPKSAAKVMLGALVWAEAGIQRARARTTPNSVKRMAALKRPR